MKRCFLTLLPLILLTTLFAGIFAKNVSAAGNEGEPCMNGVTCLNNLICTYPETQYSRCQTQENINEENPNYNQNSNVDQNFKIQELLNSSNNQTPGLSRITNIGDIFTKGGFDLINIIFIIVGLLFFANLIMVGWEYMLSSGDPKKVQAASTRLTNGLIGLIMAVAAYIIVRLISQIFGLGGSTTTPII